MHLDSERSAPAESMHVFTEMKMRVWARGTSLPSYDVLLWGVRLHHVSNVQARWVISAYQSCDLLSENVVVLGWKEVQYKWHIKAAVRGNEKTITSDLLCEGSLERGTKIDRRGGVWRCWQVEAAKRDRAATSFAFHCAIIDYHDKCTWPNYNTTRTKEALDNGSLTAMWL